MAFIRVETDRRTRDDGPGLTKHVFTREYTPETKYRARVRKIYASGRHGPWSTVEATAPKDGSMSAENVVQGSTTMSGATPSTSTRTTSGGSGGP